jgi:hypothetical protein
MVAMAKAKPGSIRIAVQGATNALTLAQTEDKTGVRLEGVP